MDEFLKTLGTVLLWLLVISFTVVPWAIGITQMFQTLFGGGS